MSERYTLEQHQQFRRQEDEKARAEQEQTKNRVIKANQKRMWISGGGTEESFEAAWPRIKAAMEQARVDLTLEREAQARAQMSQHSRI